MLQIAARLREILRSKLGVTLSCGVASTKLLARLVSPLHKPDGLTALAPAAAADFLCSQPIKAIPSLRWAWLQSGSSELDHRASELPHLHAAIKL